MVPAHRPSSLGHRLASLVLSLAFFVPVAGAQPTLEKPSPRVDPSLLALHAQKSGQASPYRAGPSDLSPALPDGDAFVVIDAVAEGDPATLLRDLQQLGLEQGAAVGRIVSGRLPVGAIDELEGVKSLRSARPALFKTNVGATTSQGDASMNTDDVRALLGLDGSGITVGALSDSYDFLGGAAADVASGDLPAGVVVLEESGSTDEGRAMLQLIYDAAPGADLAFHTANGGQANFAQGILELATVAGADVIVDDIIYFAEPMFQDGIIAQAVDAVNGMGIPYFSSAGNQERDAYESPFRSSGVPGVFGGDRHDFDPGPAVNDLQSVTFGSGVTFLSFQWSNPYFSVSGPPGANADVDIVLYSSVGGFTGLGGFAFNLGGDPIEVFGVFCPSICPAQIGLELFAGPAPSLMKVVWFGNLTINEFATDSGPLYGHANAAGAEAVGAARYDATPAFGVSPPGIEFFSSAGTTPILFDLAGNPLPAPDLRLKPEIVAPDGTNNTFFGFDYEGDGFPNFFGTSAAAPHAAAAAALLLQGYPSLSPADVYDALEMTAIDMDDPLTPGFDAGFDFRTGYGLIDVFAAALALDQTPPVVTVADEPITLWPPNHSYASLGVEDFVVAASDDVTPGLSVSDVYIVSISSDEAENGRGDGNTTDDIVIPSCQTALLRAERSGRGNGRVYTVEVAAQDLSGNVGTATFEVWVPKSRKSGAIADGAVYSVDSACDSATASPARLALASPAARVAAPNAVALAQNHPNPFSATTAIDFAVPEAGPVELLVFDVLGRQVATLVDEDLSAGEHTAHWEAGGLPNGVYVYRLRAAGFSEAKQMMVVR